MSSHGSTVTAGPTFAYRAVTEALGRTANPPDGIDLTALQYAFVGAEPIVYRTLRHFTESLAPLGLRQDVLVPCYGMAESVLATTLALGAAPQGPLNFGRVRVAEAGDGGEPLVCCGPHVEGMRVAILGADGNELADGEVGDIRISGPSVMAGYQQPDGTVYAPPDGWHDTGDRGFRCDGQLFVVGRSKEMLIVRGRNLPPYDVERVIGELAEVGQGQAVVFSVADRSRGGERNVAVVAVGISDDDGQRRVRAQAAARVRQVLGISLDDVVVVPRRAIPRTTSGKIQRVKMRELYQAGRL
jgi:acyl-CoA synthetase (AMP-forming)/AMP-acid ligase II